MFTVTKMHIEIYLNILPVILRQFSSWRIRIFRRFVSPERIAVLKTFGLLQKYAYVRLHFLVAGGCGHYS